MSFAIVNIEATGPTQDVVVPGFGDVVAAIGILAHQEQRDIGLVVPHCGFSLGYYANAGDYANGYSTGGAATDAVAVSVSQARGSDSTFLDVQEWDKAEHFGGSVTVSACQASPIANGIRLNWTTGPVQAHSIVVVLIGGDIPRAHSGGVLLSTIPGGPWPETIGWRPSLIFTQCNQGYSNRQGPYMTHQFGACVDGAVPNEQFHTHFAGSSNESVPVNLGAYATDSVTSWQDQRANEPVIGHQAIEITADGFVIDNVPGVGSEFATSTMVRYLALDLGEHYAATFQHRETPPTTTIETIPTPGIDPEFLWSHGGTYLERDLQRTNQSDGFGYGFAVKGNPDRTIFQQYQSGTSSRTVAQALVDPNFLHWLHPSTGANRHMLARVQSMGEEQYEIDWSAVQRTQYPWANIVVGRKAAPPPATVRPRFWIT